MRKIESDLELDLSWPHLHHMGRAPVRAAIAARIFANSLRGLGLQVLMPDGQVMGAGHGDFTSGGSPAIQIVKPQDFFTRLGRDGTLGFGESYLAGQWHAGLRPQDPVAESDELVAWLRIYARFLSGRSPTPKWLQRLWRLNLPRPEPNSVEGARRNVRAHYDLRPELFKLFLDSSMVYSSAFFTETDDLASAQLRKIDAILDLARVTGGTRLLDVGSGFGGLALRAARCRHADVTGITLSASQYAYSMKRCEDAGGTEDPEFLLEDYREHTGTYDAITCVEMIEAVGAEFWPEFFRRMDQLLAPDGYLALQVITFPHSRMLSAANDFSWVDRYIFPGGALPSLREIDHIMSFSTRLEIVEARRLTDSYAQTLRSWRTNFIHADKEVASLGYNETFRRLWVLYFAYFEAGFRARYCDVWQLGIVKRNSGSGR
jgi:cyclopropane-fatty-acyl-phospholipid synthase